ncbi:hypothetical protein EC9_47060 [Rosistilla ulvae]|uniref:Uncharacterized protein n=1 Tax=Rosistilla ulvae TaxID=1930277 RepID=A0A517M6L7_9BACT|nr:hypothetical protein [Rosistilla ulvae]QDS90497.1 hypothetical protein EC9_47060 [Rosistilla ulvae]
MNAAESQPLQRLAQADALHLPGGRFTLGLPDAIRQTTADGTRDSICWIPDSICWRRPLYAVVSSRIGRHLHRRHDWFALLRQAIAATRQDAATLLISDGTAAAPWIQRAADRFACPAITICVSPENEDFDRWIGRIQKHPPTDRIAISPPIAPSTAIADAPRRDAVTIFLADRVYAPLVSSGGNIDRLLERRLSDRRWNPASVWIAIDPKNRTAQSHIERGAVGWMLAPRHARVSSDPPEDAPTNHVTLDELLSQRGESDDADHWPYLVHCTRERDGAWPDQSEADFHDDLLSGDCTCESGPLATLRRILQTGRLLATDRLTRDGQPVVCLSARPLSDLLGSRVFRSHLGRWDYEPYGIAIHRSLLETQGSRPAIYGDADDFAALAPADQAFFQDRGTTHDWRLEKEWRIAADIDLTTIASHEAFVFVRSVRDLPPIARYCRWPIVVVGV